MLLPPLLRPWRRVPLMLLPGLSLVPRRRVSPIHAPRVAQARLLFLPLGARGPPPLRELLLLPPRATPRPPWPTRVPTSPPPE